MAEQNYRPNKYVDFLSEFGGGINSGVAGLLLEKNQLSTAVNASLREGFIHPRPATVLRTLNYNGNTALLSIVNTGLFQGAGYYRPDTGTEMLLASIGGHLISFTEQGYGGVWNVNDISVPGDLNDPNQSQAWMWQAEKWMIVNDGSGDLPIFFDGVISRRSFGDSTLLATALAASPGTAPAIGQIVTATLATDYNGPTNIPVIFNGAFYQLSQSGGPSGLTFPVILTNISDTPGNTVGGSTNIVNNPKVAASIVASPGPSYILIYEFNPANFFFVVDSFSGVAIGNQLVATGTAAIGNVGNVTRTWTVTVTGLSVQSGFNVITGTTPAGTPGSYNVSVGATVFFSGVTKPSVVVGVTAGPFTVPGVGSSVQVNLTQPYTGPAGERVTINGAAYSIASAATPPGGPTVLLLNLSDTSGASYQLPLKIMSVPELFAGRMGVYGNGRNWFSSVAGTQYFASDIVGGGSGTPAYNFRDAVLRMTENDFLSGGGSFSLPGTGDVISAMSFPPVLDSSLGVGQLQIFTPFSVFANNAPADRTTWANLTWPIQTESLKDQGAIAQDSTVIVNSDVFFRSDFNLCSLVLARRQFQLNEWGNKPIADEMQRILQNDNSLLLTYGSGVSFDNRFLTTVGPTQAGTGVYHLGLISLNFDPLSSLRKSDPPVWEGSFTGVNILKLVTGRVNGLRRCFAFTANQLTNQMELYELLAEAVAAQANTFTDIGDSGPTPITWMFETAAIFNKDVHSLTELIQLRDGEVYLSEITGTVSVSVYYRPDFFPCWTLWNQFTVCATAGSESTYRTRVGLGEPSPQPGEPGNNRPLRMGYFFQLRFVVSGYCNINGVRISAITAPEAVFAPVNTPQQCDTINCNTTPDLQIYSLQNPPAS